MSQRLDPGKGMWVMIAVLAVYILSEYLAARLSGSRMLGLLAKLVLVGALLIYWRAWFSFRLRLDFGAVLFGAGIGVMWASIDSFYPHIGALNGTAFNGWEIALKMLAGVLVAPLVEEFFTRFFLHRHIQSHDWLSVPLGQYTFSAFAFTTLFFGFAHSAWLAGILTGMAMNWLWYQRKDMNSIVLAHAAANLTLGLIVVVYGSWQLW